MERLWNAAVLAVVLVAAASQGYAQTEAGLLAQGDRAHQERRSKDALNLYLRAIEADPSNYEALWKASRSEVDLAEVSEQGPELDALLAAARQHAEAAIRARPGDAEGHFSLARALGRHALSLGARDRIKFSRMIRDEALAALKINSAHPGAMHVLGMWNAEIMRVGGLSRVFARTFLGADVFNLASWEEAQRLLETAAREDPQRIIHRLDLAGIYADRGDKARARELYQEIASAPVVEPNDDLYKRQAAERLKKL